MRESSSPIVYHLTGPKIIHQAATSQYLQRWAADQPRNGGYYRPGDECTQSTLAEPVISNTNSDNRRRHNTAGQINCISKVLHVLEPPECTAFYNI